MISRLILCLAMSTGYFHAMSQQHYRDSLTRSLMVSQDNIAKVFTMSLLSQYYSLLYPDSATYYADREIELAQKINFTYGEAQGYIDKGESYDRVGNFAAGLEMAFKSLELAKSLGAEKTKILASAYSLIGQVNAMSGNADVSKRYYQQSQGLYESLGNDEQVCLLDFKQAFVMMITGNMDSAMYHLNIGNKKRDVLNVIRTPLPWLISANILNSKGSNDSAEIYVMKGIERCKKNNAVFLLATFYLTKSRLFGSKGMSDSAIFYARQGFNLARRNHYKPFEVEGSGHLAYFYRSANKSDSALKYMTNMVELNDELFGAAKSAQFQRVGYDEERKQRELETARENYQSQIRFYALLGTVGFVLLVAFVFWRNSKLKQKANILLNEQKEKAENALTDLKTAQTQLIQSEKMASLGELTAGIAHEIQNPLNFVNNFSEINSELIEELEFELGAGNSDGAMAVAGRIKENEQRISLHGKRADSIVKGMLQHSRNGQGQRERTDINALVDECLRLTYHGFRSKDKSVNFTMQSNFDKSVGTIEVVPQDLGRVMLNLFNNAFYSLTEKKKEHIESFEPVLSVSTSKKDGKVIIRIKDNGNGIDQKVLDKIFQPFFTTKPSGSGTGLGLSISYDIITKGHGGELKVDTCVGEYAEFIIALPQPN